MDGAAAAGAGVKATSSLSTLAASSKPPVMASTRSTGVPWCVGFVYGVKLGHRFPVAPAAARTPAPADSPTHAQPRPAPMNRLLVPASMNASGIKGSPPVSPER